MPFDVRRLLSLGRVSSVAVSPDGTYAVAAVARLDEEHRAKYVADLWRVPLDGSPATQLTRGKFNDRAPCFRRDGAVGFLSNRPAESASDDDSERDQVWVLPNGMGEPTCVTDEPLGVSEFKFARRADLLVVIADVLAGVPESDQRTRAKDLDKHGPTDLFFPSRSGPIRHWDHWLGRARPHVIAYDEHGRRDLTPDADRHFTGDVAFDVSQHGAYVVITERVESTDRLIDFAILLIDAKDGSKRRLALGAQLEHGHPVFTRDATRVYFNRQRRTRERHGKVELCVADVASGATHVLCESWDRWPIPHAPVGDDIACVADDEGAVPVFLIAPKTNTVTRVTSRASGGTHDALVATDDGRIVGIRHTLRAPPELFVIDARADQAPTMLAPLSGFDEADLATHETTQFDVQASDGARVQTWLVRPETNARPKTVLWIHGGPVGFFGDGWHWRWNPHVLASAGYAIALPNARGSTGFGTDYVDGIWNNAWGGQCYDDLMCVADALEKRDDVDGASVAAMGGSFGGYMCNFIGGQTTRFRALVTHASIFHLEAMCGASDYGPYFAIEMGTTPWKDRAAFERHSPHRFIGKWKTPTLVLHGEKDYRVPVSEALILFDALQEHGVESELVVFPDENHWILRPRNIEAWYGHVLRFLGEHL